MEALRLDQVSVDFGKLSALNRVVLSIDRGERRGLIGPNGAGKTTLFNVACGYLKPSTGDVYLFGKKATGMSPHKYVKAGIARTFQKSNIFLKLTVLENLLLALDQKALRLDSFTMRGHTTLQKGEALLSRFGLGDKKHWPASALSYGEQRVLEIALALALEPRIILLDEPTAGLSGAEVSIIGDIIRSLSSDITVVIIEHDMDVIFDLSEKISVLHHGKVIAEGTGEQIRSNPQVREIYLGRSKE